MNRTDNRAISSAEAKQNFPGTNIFYHLFRDTQNNKHIVILEDTEDTGSEDQQQNLDDEDEEDEVTFKKQLYFRRGLSF